MLVRVETPHFVAGIVLADGRVVRAAPILRWALGKDRAYLSPYFAKKGWRAMIIGE